MSGSKGLTGSDTMIAICGGEVRRAVVVGCEPHTSRAIAEWASSPSVQEIVRVPTQVARDFLFKKWPGRDAAITETAARIALKEEGRDG